MAETGCLKDGHFQNLEVENTTILGGGTNTVTIPGAFISAPRCFRNQLITNTLSMATETASPNDLVEFAHYLGSLDSDGFTAALFNRHFSSATGVAEASVPIVASNDPIVLNKAIRLTGDCGTVDFENSAAVHDSGTKSLIIFDGNTISGSDVITISLKSDDGIDASACQVVVEAADTGELTAVANPSDDDDEDITLTASGGATIIKGSYLYIEGTATATVALKGCIRLSAGALTVATSGS
jgi:hypothetical protein